MGSLLQSVHLPLFTVVRAGALDGVPEVLGDAHLTFRRALVVSGRGATAPLGQRLATSLEASGVSVRVEDTSGGTFAEADRLKRDVIEGFFPNVLLAVGGGSVLDVVKLAASERRLPWVSVPTSASNDGFCSPVAVLRGGDGRRSIGAQMPVGVVVDLDVLRGSDVRLRRAGLGDLLSNLTACEDWRRAAAAGKAVVNGMARTLASSAARGVLSAASTDMDNPALLEQLVEGLILSGVSMEVSGTSRPCSGSEHLISHELDRLGAGHGLHGEQVGVATLFCTALQGGDPRELRRFAQGAGLVVTPTGLGVEREQFLAAARQAPDTRPGRWTVLSAVGEDELLAAWDLAYGDS